MMKLSEMPTIQAAACMVDLAAPVEKIMSHPKVAEMLESRGKTTMSVIDFAKVIIQLVPVMMRDYYKDMVRVVAVLTNKSTEEINAQPIKETIADIRGFWDEDLKTFFSSSAPTEQGASSM